MDQGGERRRERTGCGGRETDRARGVGPAPGRPWRHGAAGAHRHRATAGRRQPARRPPAGSGKAAAQVSAAPKFRKLGSPASSRHARSPRRAVSDPDRSPDAYGARTGPAGKYIKTLYYGKLRRYWAFSTICVSMRNIGFHYERSGTRPGSVDRSISIPSSGAAASRALRFGGDESPKCVRSRARAAASRFGSLSTAATRRTSVTSSRGIFTSQRTRPSRFRRSR